MTGMSDDQVQSYGTPGIITSTENAGRRHTATTLGITFVELPVGVISRLPTSFGCVPFADKLTYFRWFGFRRQLIHCRLDEAAERSHASAMFPSRPTG